MKPYSSNESPGNDVTADSMESARFKASGCAFCGGHGLATVYHKLYQKDRTIFHYTDRDGIARQKALRTMVYCQCAAGMKTQILHQQTAKEIYERTATLHDVLHEVYPNWTVDDPTDNYDEDLLPGWSPEQKVRWANLMRVRKRRRA